VLYLGALLHGQVAQDVLKPLVHFLHVAHRTIGPPT
jgi:hypothetical protein